MPDVPEICGSLRELADMAYRQGRFGYWGHLTDAVRLLTKAYLPEQCCAFCEEPKEQCRCDERRQEEKDA